jgi:hypothetical protein
MSEPSSPQRRSVALPSLLCLLVSALVHSVWLLASRGGLPLETGPRFDLRTQVEFGLAALPTPGAAASAAAAPPKLPEPKHPTKPRRAKAAPDPDAFRFKADASAAAEPTPQPVAAANEAEEGAAQSGDGIVAGAVGDGSGLGDGGYAPLGATLALNVDLERVRKTALVLEMQPLLEIIPEWQLLLSGSGIDPARDLQRVFVATPNLERSSLVVAARHRLARARISAAVDQLAAEQGQAAPFRRDSGFEVAAWRNRGPTARVIALTADDQFTITRAADLARVLSVAQALTQLRSQQGFESHELAEQGGLLAMLPNEAAALWIEGVPKYVHGDVAGVPRSLRLSIYHVDQFNSELRVRGQYASPTAAADALQAMDALRVSLGNEPKLIFLGLKSALDNAQLEQSGAALHLQVRLTLHQTRYLLRYLTRALRLGGS